MANALSNMDNWTHDPLAAAQGIKSGTGGGGNSPLAKGSILQQGGQQSVSKAVPANLLGLYNAKRSGGMSHEEAVAWMKSQPQFSAAMQDF